MEFDLVEFDLVEFDLVEFLLKECAELLVRRPERK